MWLIQSVMIDIQSIATIIAVNLMVLPIGLMATTQNYHLSGVTTGVTMTLQEDINLVYKGPWVRTAQMRLFNILETEYGFPKATCRSLIHLMWDFLNENFGDTLHEGQMKYQAVASEEPPGKITTELKSVPAHLTLHDRNDIHILSQEGIAGLRKKKILRLANEAYEQGGLLTQEDLAVMLCSSRRTIRRDIKELKNQDQFIPTRGTMKDIGPGISHKSKIIQLWLEGYEYTDLERKTGHSGSSIQRYLASFSKVVRFHTKKYNSKEIHELTDVSERLVKEYLTLFDEFKDHPESKDRLEQILVQNQALKKNLPHRKYRGGEVTT